MDLTINQIGPFYSLIRNLNVSASFHFLNPNKTSSVEICPDLTIALKQWSKFKYCIVKYNIIFL